MSDLPTDHRNDVTFAVRAQRTPDVLPRVLDIFARRNLVPDRWASLRAGPARAHLVFEIEIGGLAETVAERIAASMRQIVNVDSVVASRGADQVALNDERVARGLAVRWSLKDRRLRREAGQHGIEVAPVVG